ncbi:MAG: hypothetical protein WAO55_07595 [Candidatus Manganitrophaceae bacterium]
MRRFQLFGALLIVTFLIGFLAGCGKGGGEPGVNPAEGSTWDQMAWDKGKWG